MRTVQRDALEQGGVVGDHHAAFAQGRDVLLLVETEAAGHAHAAGFAPLVFGADRVAGVLDHGDAVRLAIARIGVHVAALAVQMHRQNRLGVRA